MMQDPMANLSADPAAQVSSDGDNTKQVFDPMAMQMNLQRIDRIRSVMGIAAGCVAGITGLTGLQGFGKILPLPLIRLGGVGYGSTDVLIFLYFFHSLFLCTPLICLLEYMGLENEFSTGSLHKAVLVCLSHYGSATIGHVFHTVLDSVLRASLSLLKRN